MTEIHLSEQDRAFVDEQIKAGIYKDAEEVIHAGLRLLGSNEGRYVELQRLIQEGLDDVEAGRVVEFSSEEEFTAHILKLSEEQNETSKAGRFSPSAERPSHRP